MDFQTLKNSLIAKWLVAIAIMTVIGLSIGTYSNTAKAEISAEAQTLIDQRIKDSEKWNTGTKMVQDGQKMVTDAEAAARSRENILCTDFKLRWDNDKKTVVADENCPLN